MKHFWGGVSIEEIQQRTARIARRTIPEDREQPRRAAVLLGLCEVAGKACILFTKRADDVPTHKGQVSFPGGMAEPGDSGPIATALRETHEEIGLRENTIEVLGLLHDVRAITGVPVTPVLGYLGKIDPVKLEIDTRETASAFALSVEDLCHSQSRHRVQYDQRGSYPVFERSPWPVWGLTAVMVDEFLRDTMNWILWDDAGNPVEPVAETKDSLV